ncbi:MAG: MaoC family dehydratase N-terminal domain-containing protein [Rhodovarius sp.]|nr:MaoC family dehydratase N-terminal domain-containing protein [Rhodovarius sp.]
MGRYAEYLGRSETRQDRADPRLFEAMAATLDLPSAPAELPPLWHWMLFQDWRRPGSLGPDGHPKRGGFLPPVHHLPRRMWAGGRITFAGPAILRDDVLTRSSTIAAIEEKTGASGELVFVTVRHAIAGPRGLVLEEEQDIVYRSAEGAAVKPASAAPDWPRAIRRVVLPDPVLLFRYSALTGNGHRIHYDHRYVTAVEGYPGLIVHGPLQATWLAALAQEAAGPRARLLRFRFRGRRPCFVDRPLTLFAEAEGRTVRLESRDDTGATCMEAEAVFA